ncbi:CbiQ family ECF transporter T component [Patulibacter medicamentivorans]|nr:CbiQ family ECF transporter T component [Patulibacter medicamentivorans]
MMRTVAAAGAPTDTAPGRCARAGRAAGGLLIAMTYRPGTSVLHVVRPAIGAGYCAALIVLTLTVTHPLVLAGLLAGVLAAGAATGALAAQRRALLLGLPMALLVVLVNGLASRHGVTVVARLGSLPGLGRIDVTAEALAAGALLGLRLLVVVLCGVLLARAIDPDGLLRAARRSWPQAALTAALSLRIVPVLARDGQRMADARRCRPPGTAGAATDRAARLLVLRSVTGSVLDRATDLATTLELRGHRLGGRAVRDRHPWSRHDRAVAAASLALVALAAAIVASRAAGGHGLLTQVAAVGTTPRLSIPIDAATVGLSLALPLLIGAPLLARRGRS